MSQSRLRVGNRGGVAAGLENWDDDFLDQTSAPSSPERTRTGTNSAIRHPLRARTSMDSDAWDVSSDEEARHASPFPPVLPTISTSTSAPTGLLPSPIITSSSRHAAHPSRGSLTRRSTRDRDDSRWELESNDEAFYTPRETMYLETLESPVSSGSHYDPSAPSYSHYDPTEPRSRQSVAALAMADDEHDDEEEDEELEADKTVTLSRPPPVTVETESESEYERDKIRRDGRTSRRTPRASSAAISPEGISQPPPVVTAVPASTSPVPPSPSPTHSRSHSNTQIYGRPSIGAASSIFSPSITSTAPLRGPSAPPPTSKYPSRPMQRDTREHGGERPPRRLRKKRRRPEDSGMVELTAMSHEEPLPPPPLPPPPVPVLPTTPEPDLPPLPQEPPLTPTTPAPPSTEPPSPLPAIPPKSPKRPTLPLDNEPPPPVPPPPTSPYAAYPPPPAQNASSRHIFHGSVSSSANPAALLTRLSSFRRFLPRSTSATSNRAPQSPPTVAARHPARAQSESPTSAAPPPEPAPVLPGLQVASAAAAGTAAGQRKSKGSAPAVLEAGQDPEGMFGPGPPEEIPPVPALPDAEMRMGLGRRVAQVVPADDADVPPGIVLEDAQGEPHGVSGEPLEAKAEERPEEAVSKIATAEEGKKRERKEKSGRDWTKLMERARSATVSGVVSPPPIPPPPAPVTKSEHRENRKPRKLSHRRPHHKEDGIKRARDSLDLSTAPPLPSVASERALEELAAAEAEAEGDPVKESRKSGPVPHASTSELVPLFNPGTSPKGRSPSPLSSRAASPLNVPRPITPSYSRAMTPISPTPLTPISPSKALPHLPMDRKGSQGSELRIPQRISLQQRSLKEGLTDVRQFAGIVEDLRDLQAQHGTLLAFLAASASPRSNKLPRAVRRGSQASQMQVEVGLARLEATNQVWWELAGVLVDLGGSRPNGSVRAAKDRLNVRDAMQESSGARSEPEFEGREEGRSGPIDILQPGQRSRYRAASMAATKHAGLGISPTSPALPSNLEPGLQAPRSASLGIEKVSQKEEVPKELTSRQLILLAEMLHEPETTRVVEYGEHAMVEFVARSRAPSRAGLHTPLPVSSLTSRPPTRTSNIQMSPSNADTIGRPRRGSKIMSNIKDIFSGKKSNRDSVDGGGYVTSDAEGPPTNGARLHRRSSSRPPTTQPGGDSARFRSGGSSRRSPRKPSLGSIFGSRQAHEKREPGERNLPPTVVGRAPRGNGSSTTVDTDLEDASDWDRLDHGNDGVPTVRGRPGLNGNNPPRSRPALPIASAHTSPGKTLSIQTSYTRDTSSRMSERPPLESAKLALTPENIRPLLGHAREVRHHLEECISDLRALQPRGDIKL